MCYIWVCVAYANHAQRERYLHAEGTLVIHRAYAQLDARSLRACWYSLCIRTHTLCARYSNVSSTVWERYEHGARTLVPPNLIHTQGKLCVCGLLSYAQRTQNQYANIWRGLKKQEIPNLRNRCDSNPGPLLWTPKAYPLQHNSTKQRSFWVCSWSYMSSTGSNKY